MIFCEISIQDQEKNSNSQHLKRGFQIFCVILHLLVDSLGLLKGYQSSIYALRKYKNREKEIDLNSIPESDFDLDNY